MDVSDKDSQFLEESISLKPDDFENLEIDASEDDYFLVEFRTE